MTTDPELRTLMRAARRASESLVSRLEGYGELVPGRQEEAALSADIARRVLDVERMFRDFSERCRNLREMLEDPDLQMPEGPRDDVI